MWTSILQTEWRWRELEQEYADRECPICGYLNKHLYLKETEGWFICARCKAETQALKDMPMVKVPLLTPQQLAAKKI